jgi:hypothetical protein
MAEADTTAAGERIAVHCDACGRDWRVPANLAGHHGKCACGHVLIVPHAEAPPGTVKCPHCGKWTRPEGWCEWCSEPFESRSPADLAAVHAVAPDRDVVARISAAERVAFSLGSVVPFGGAIFLRIKAPHGLAFIAWMFALIGALWLWKVWTAPDEVVANAEGVRWRRRGRERHCIWSDVRSVTLPGPRASIGICTSAGNMHFLGIGDDMRLLKFAQQKMKAHRADAGERGRWL